jgi:hypothetical protein
VTHHRYILVNMDVWLVDPNDDGTVSGPPDAALAADLASKVQGLKPKGKDKEHDVHKTTVVSTKSQTKKP